MIWRVLAALGVLGLLLLGWGYANILSDPIVREARVALPVWPTGAPPIRVALIGDVHFQGPDMPPERVARAPLSRRRGAPPRVTPLLPP